MVDLLKHLIIPNGVYAYFVGVTTGIQGKLDSKISLFIGDTYRSEPIEDNFLIDQTNFDFNGNNLIRNTFHIKFLMILLIMIS